MKRIFLFSSILFALGVGLSSCIYNKVVEESEEITPPPPPPPPAEAIRKTFYLRFNTIEIEDVVSTYAYPDLRGSVPVMLWGRSEDVGVFMNGDNTIVNVNKKYHLNDDQNAHGSRTALLYDTITTSLQKAVCYGYYPYQVSTSGTNVSRRLNNVQDQSADNNSERLMDNANTVNLFMISPPTEEFEISNGVGVLEFANVFSFLRIQVTKSSDFNTFNGQRIKGVTLYIADENDLSIPLDYNLAGDYTIDVSKPIGSGYNNPNFISGEKSITATVTGGNVISESFVSSPYVWFIVNPLTIESNERLVSIIETEMYKVITAHDITTLKANNVYGLNVVAEADNTTSDKIIMTHYSEDQASNCYVVSQAGLCQIPLNTRNKVDLRGATVDWLWASKEKGGDGFDISELIDPASIEYDDDLGKKYVRFRVGDSFGRYTKGNVILALKDASGNIVWTWHIWITDEPGDVQYEPGKLFLDRNIGALSVNMVSTGIDNYGFVYQWGRKDPFFGGNGLENETTALTLAKNNTIINEASFDPSVAEWSPFNTTSGTLNMSITNPMRFICNNNSLLSKNEPADWLSENIPAPWSDDYKTDYDPCPYGYKVPSKADLSSLLEFEADNTTPKNFKLKDSKYWEYSFGGRSSVWPAAGMRQGRTTVGDYTGAQLVYSGTNSAFGQCFYWTSSPINVDGFTLPGGSHRVYTTHTTDPVTGVVASFTFYKDDYGDNADAYPVRCVKMP